MRIDVTEEDIKEGSRNDCQYCPVAIAVRRETGLLFFVDGLFAFDPTQRSINIPLPGKVVNFVMRFDTGEPVVPFSFDLDIQPEIA